MVDAELVGTKHITFQSTDIFSVLNTIADAWQTEWWVDKGVLHLSKFEKEEPIYDVYSVEFLTYFGLIVKRHYLYSSIV